MKFNALEVITAEATAPGSSGASFSAVSGDSLTIRATARKAKLVGLWSNFQTAGFYRVTSPRLHDTSLGIQAQTAANHDEVRIPLVQELTPQDTLQVFGAGSATAGDIEQVSLLIGYEGLSGVNARLATKAAVLKNARELFSIRASITTGSSGGYSGSEAINSDQDQFKANEDYAILGAWADSDVCTIGLTSPDWGNLRIGIPGKTGPRQNAGWFMDLSERLGQSEVVPVFNGSNRATTTIDVAGNEAVPGTVVVTVMMARLK